MCCAVPSRSVVSDSATAWTAVHQAPLSMELSRQEYWSGLPCPPPGDLSTQGLNPGLPHCRQILSQLSYWGSPQPSHPCSNCSSWPEFVFQQKVPI